MHVMAINVYAKPSLPEKKVNSGPFWLCVMNRPLENHELRALLLEWSLMGCIFSELCVLIDDCSLAACQHVLKKKVRNL